nr:hypothetical protein BJQ95_03107 [Cryobacterium sp. SO1]
MKLSNSTDGRAVGSMVAIRLRIGGNDGSATSHSARRSVYSTTPAHAVGAASISPRTANSSASAMS